MRKLLALSYVILLVGFTCIAHAQLTQTGAGPKAGGGGGGGGGCSGTIPSITAPNDLTNAAWVTAAQDIGAGTGAPDPSSGTTGSFATVSATASNASWTQILSPNLSPATTYRLTGYLKASSGSPWILVGFSDAIANAAQSNFNVSGTGTVGLPNIAGTGTLTCVQAAAAGNGFVKVDIAATFSSVPNPQKAAFSPCDGNNVCTVTVNQQFFFWGAGQ